MSEADEKQRNFVPQLDAVLEALADEVEGWADGLGIELTYTDPVLDEQGENEWALRLRKATDWARRTVVSLLTAQRKTDLLADLKHRVDELLTAADAYEQRLEAMEDQRRVHVEGIVARYRKMHGDEDPNAIRLMGLCQGIKRVWTFGFDGGELETPDEFAEAIDRSWLEEDGAKRKAHAEMQRHARELAEHLRLMAGAEAQAAAQQAPAAEKPAAQETGAAESKPETKKRGKRGPKRLSLKQAWRYLTVLQEWAGIQERNQKLLQRDRVRKIQVAEEQKITVQELDAMLGWYAKHRGSGLFPDDPRTLSKGELQQWFE